MSVPSVPMIAGTLQTDPRSGGIKRNSGVNVLPNVAKTWADVRNDSNPAVDWLIVGYDGASRTDITVLAKGMGGIDVCSLALPERQAVFGGCRLKESGRFVTFFYADDDTSTMQRGRASMHKNGVLNVLEGSDGEIDMYRGLTERETNLPHAGGGILTAAALSSAPSRPLPTVSLPRPTPPPEQNMRPAPVAPRQTPVQAQAVPSIPSAPPAVTKKESQGGSYSTSNGVTAIYSYDELRDIRDVASLPSGVDPLHRELSLSDVEFMGVFGIDKPSFGKLPAWKQAAQKKAKGLF